VRLGRPADAGDLLVVLASVPEGIGERTLAALGSYADALARAVAEARGSGGRSSLLPPPELLAECEEIRAARLSAIKAQEFTDAAELRERERKLLERALKPVEERREEFVAQMRARLGLLTP